MLRSCFDVALPGKAKYEKILVLEGVHNAITRLRRHSARGDSVSQQRIINVGILEALVVVELQLMLMETHLHVKKTKNAVETRCVECTCI